MLQTLRSALRVRVHGGPFVLSVTERMVQPSTERVILEGPDPVRLLLFGGDYATGYNVRSRHEAVDGALAALLHAELHRGVIIENRSVPGIPLDAVAESLRAAGAHTFHAVVWAPTFGEAARRPIARPWRTAAEAIVEKVTSTSDAGLVLLTIPSLLGRQPIAVLARSQAAVLNRALQRVADRHPHVLAVTPPPIALADVHALDGAAAYRQVAEALLPALLALLHATGRAPDPAAGPPAAAHR